MKITKINFSKIKWILKHDIFHNAPFRTIFKVINWELKRIKNKKFVYHFDDSLIIFLYPADGVARLTYYFNYHEPLIFKFLDKYLSPGMTYIDVGANIGLYSLFVAKRVGSEYVYAFEPQPNVYAKALENINKNNIKNIKIENIGLGKCNSVCKMHIDRDSAKSYIKSSESIHFEDSAIEVSIMSFDDYVMEKKIKKIDYIKIDVEGFEYEVLLGMQNTLKFLPPEIIQIELYDDFLKRNGASISIIVNYFNIFGYKPLKLNDSAVLQSVSNRQISGDVFFMKINNV